MAKSSKNSNSVRRNEPTFVPDDAPHYPDEPFFDSDGTQYFPDETTFDPDVRAANRASKDPELSDALKKKLTAEEVFIRNAQTKKAHAEKRRADADAIYIDGPRTEQTLADAEFSRNRAHQSVAEAELARKRALQSVAETELAYQRALQQASETNLAYRRADFIAGPETRKTHSDADLAYARRDFVRGVETQKAEWEIFLMRFRALGGALTFVVLAIVAYIVLSAFFYH